MVPPQAGADIGIMFESLLTPNLNDYALAKEHLLLAVPVAATGNDGNVFNTEGFYPLLTGRDSGLSHNFPQHFEVVSF